MTTLSHSWWTQECQKVNMVSRLMKSSSVLSFSLDKSFKHSTFGNCLTALIHLANGLLSRQATEECTNQAENQRHLRRPVKAADEKSRCKQSIQFVQRKAV